MFDKGAFGKAEFPVQLGAFGQLPTYSAMPPIQQELDYPIVGPDPQLMSDIEASEKKKDLLKYVGIGLLATITGYILGREYTKSPGATAAITGAGAVALVVAGDFARSKI